MLSKNSQFLSYNLCSDPFRLNRLRYAGEKAYMQRQKNVFMLVSDKFNYIQLLFQNIIFSKNYSLIDDDKGMGLSIKMVHRSFFFASFIVSRVDSSKQL